MPLIDDKGRVFGVVNIIDLLVVLLVLAVGVAGVALVTSGGDEGAEPEPTRYATLSYTTPLESSAALLDTGETLSPIGGGDTFDVVDVYRSFDPKGDVSVVARVAYRGTPTVGGKQLYGGDNATFTTGSHRVDTTVHTVKQTETALQTTQVPVVLSVDASDPVADAIKPGQTARIGNQTVATIESVTSTFDGDTRTLRVGVELTAWDRDTIDAFDGQALRIGNPVTMVTDEVLIRGQIHELGTTTPTEE